MTILGFGAGPGPDPLEMGVIRTGKSGGSIGISHCPGRGEIRRPGRQLASDLDTLCAAGTTAVVTLVSDEELAGLGVADLGAQVRARGMAWYHMPVRDFSTPDEAFEAQWDTNGPVLLDHLRQGRRVHVHCWMGLGRAGTIAARLLVELGLDPEVAIRWVRTARPGAILTSAQEDHVRNCTRGQAPPCEVRKNC